MPCVAPSQQAVPACLRLRRGGLPSLMRPPITDRAGAQSGMGVTWQQRKLSGPPELFVANPIVFGWGISRGSANAEREAAAHFPRSSPAPVLRAGALVHALGAKPPGCYAQTNVSWIVERTIAWLNRCRRLAKDWENLNRGGRRE
jgi:hypothetical protein